MYSASRANSRVEKFFWGLFLILLASFLLAGAGYVSGAFAALSNSDKATDYIRSQVSDFTPIILILSSIFTFVFGGVGTNLISSAVINTNSCESSNSFFSLENSLDRLTAEISNYRRTNIYLVVVNIITLCALALILFWVK